MYAWEGAFENTVKEARNKELRYIKKASCLRAVNASFLIFTERTSLYFTLLAHVLMGHSVNASTVSMIDLIVPFFWLCTIFLISGSIIISLCN